MSKQYTASTVLRESRPRSRRLLGLGRSASGTVMSSVLPDNAWSELFELVVIQSGGEESYAIRAKYALYSDDEIAAGGVLTPGTDPGGVSHLRSLSDVYHSDSVVLRSDGQTAAQDGDVLTFDATNQRWYAKPGGNGVSAYGDLSGKPSINGHELASGNNTLTTLGIAAANHTHSEYLTRNDLSLAEVAYSDVAGAVEDYTHPTSSIKIGYYGASLTTADYFAMYANVNGQVVIKDMHKDDVKALLEIPSSSGGVSAYSDLSGKPSINGHELASGNNTLATLGIAAADHTHSGYAESDHNHDSVYAAKSHTHTGYAASDHNHDSVYAAKSHTHTGYAASDHNHDSVYAAKNHTHTGYAASDHNHDSAYAAKNHTHTDYLTLSGLISKDVTVKSLTIPSTSIDGFLKIGQAYLWYDNANGALCVSGASGASMDFYTTGDVGAGGPADGTGAFTWTQVLDSGIEIARLSINGGSPISVYAPAGGGGASAYSDLSGKPSINNHELASGNNTLASLGIAAASHTHSGYAASDHNHDNVYAAKNHTHTGYAASDHNHDSIYAAKNHTHTGYAASDHNHDNAYAAKNHTHDNYLPLAAGSSKALEGDLYLGSHKIYFDSTHYLEFDSTNGCFHFSADIYASGDVAASS